MELLSTRRHVIVSRSRFLGIGLIIYGVGEQDALALLCCRNTQKFSEGHLPLAEIFAVKSLDFGPVNQGKVSLYGGSLPPRQVCIFTRGKLTSQVKFTSSSKFLFIQFGNQNSVKF